MSIQLVAPFPRCKNLELATLKIDLFAIEYSGDEECGTRLALTAFALTHPHGERFAGAQVANLSAQASAGNGFSDDFLR